MNGISREEPATSSRKVALALGSNLGNRRSHLDFAVGQLAEVESLSLLGRSSLYETEPVGPTQPNFLNAVALFQCQLGPFELLDLVKSLEVERGRAPGSRWGPRVLDVDILLFGDLVLQSGRLTIPHPEMRRRAFVLVPLAEISPEMRHPGCGSTAVELRDACGEDGVWRWAPGA